MKMKMRMTNLLNVQQQEKESSEEGRDQAIDDEDLAPLVPSRPPEIAQRQKRKGPPVWQDPTAFLN